MPESDIFDSPIVERLQQIERLALSALQTDSVHHKQWYIEQILDIVTGPKWRRWLVTWQYGVKP